MGLSVCIITRNEQDNLPRCLRSVEGLASQLVVVDALSTDGTAAIARAAGAEVHERPFEGFLLQRQFALSHAREDWVMIVDADEWLDDELRQAVAEVVRGGRATGADGCQVNRRTQYLGAWIDHCGWSPEWRLRLVRRGRFRCVGMDPHDRLETDGTVERLPGRLCHRPYRSLAAHVGKVNRYTDIMADRRFAAGARVPAGALLLRPPARFVKMYLLRAGFLDGWRGLVVSGMGAVYVLLKYAKLRERWQAAALREPGSLAIPRPDAAHPET